MNKNDIFYKILFAFQLALLPLVIFATKMIEERWAVCLFVCGVLLVKIWFELFKDRYSFEHAMISAISSILTFSVLLILFGINGNLPIAISIIAVVLVIAYNILFLMYFKTHMPEFVMAVDYCYMLFECVALASLILVIFNNVASLIAVFALILTTIVSCGFKIYTKVKNLVNKSKH